MKNEKFLNNSGTSSLLALSYPAAMLLFGSLDKKAAVCDAFWFSQLSFNLHQCLVLCRNPVELC